MNGRTANLMIASFLAWTLSAMAGNALAEDDESKRKSIAADVAEQSHEYAMFDENAKLAPVGRGFAGTDSGDAAWRFDVTFDQDKAVAGLEWEHARQSAAPLFNARHVGFLTSKVRVTAPMGRDDFATFADLDGLATGFGVEANLSWRVSNISKLWNLHEDPVFLQFCRESGQKSTDSCSSSLIRQSFSGKSTKEWDDYERKLRGWSQVYAIGVRGAQSDFEYITPSFGQASSRRTGWGAHVSVTSISPYRKLQLGFGLDFQRRYEAAATRLICPSSSAQPIFCVKGAYGPPIETTKRQAWVGVKHGFGRIAYQVRATYDFSERETAVDVPIYLVRNHDGKLSAGLRLGWTSETHATAGIFVSKGFEF